LTITGENHDILVSGLGEGDIILFGLKDKNQLDICENAHTAPIVQIVSLTKLLDKYFATRCILGNVNIWSAADHPDRLFTLDDFDKDQSIINETSMNISKNMQATNELGETVMESSASEKDRMIELKWDRK